ncbi:MAG: flagellar biosynthetic protein FliO [Candidatus Eremiobacteraeota bacterium]|nr:flagellar biosynthetic protein FliO [Candidatus Eremiobacteraeota bacterium]
MLLLILFLLSVPMSGLAGADEKKLDITKLKEDTVSKEVSATSTPSGMPVNQDVKKKDQDSGEEIKENKVTPAASVNNQDADKGSWMTKEEEKGKGEIKGRELNLAYLTRVAFSLIAICVVVYFFLRFFGKFMGGGSAFGNKKAMIKILEKQTLGTNKQVCIIEVPGKTVLVGITENEMNVLCELDTETVEEFNEKTGEEKREAQESKPSAVNYLTDVFLRRFQSGK